MEADTKQGSSTGFVTVPKQGEQRGAAGNVLIEGGVGRGKAEITENLEKFIEQFGVSCVSQDGWREGKEEADPR